MSETLREAIERLAEEATRRAFPDIALIDDLRAALAEHPATPAEHAEVAEGEREALADALAPSLYEALMEATHDSWRQWRYLNTHGREKHRKHAAEIVADALLPTVAALTAKARAEAAEEWVEWGVRRTWGPQPGEVARFERDRRTAEKCAKDWPGTLVIRTVTAGEWASA